MSASDQIFSAISNPSPSASAMSWDELKAAKAAAEQMAVRRINTHSPELQGELEAYREKYLARRTVTIPGTNHRLDVYAKGMLGEIMARTPCRIYDLPELKLRCDTAFVDTTGRLYMADTFFRVLVHEERDLGYNSLDFIFSHETEHLRRLHLQRMLNFPADVANIAQDIRINTDNITSIVADAYIAGNGHHPSESTLRYGVQQYYENSIGPSLRSGCAMSKYDDYIKWRGLSEEAIASQLLAEVKSKPQNPEQEVSFPKLCEAVAQDLDRMKAHSIGLGNITVTAALAALADECRLVGKSKGRVGPKQLKDLDEGLETVKMTTEMTLRNLDHDQAIVLASTSGSPVASVSVGDAFIESITPIERISVLQQILRIAHSPQQSGPSSQSGGLKIKDLDLPRSGHGSGAQKQHQNSPGASGKEQKVDQSFNHVMDANELADILERAGVEGARSVLGYDDPDKIAAEEAASQESVARALSQVAQDLAKVGADRYPGGHHAEYAVGQMVDFYKPKLSLKIAIQNLLEAAGNQSRYDHEEPWGQYYTSAHDQGLDSEDEVGYMGSYTTSKPQRPLALTIIDSSMSVDDDMLKLFIGESVNFGRENDSGSSAEVVIAFADSIARGQPLVVNADNYETLLREGVDYGGRGGTDITSGIVGSLRLVRPDSFSDDVSPEVQSLRGRRIEAIIYFTDADANAPKLRDLEAAAQDLGLARLPPILFVVPDTCVNDRFAKGVKGYAELIYVGKSDFEFDIAEIDASIAERGLRSSNLKM